jgi:phosphoribosyl-ATP pyrophosphohydrolase/phosphoribosyl-AMP cyclohydrolase
MTAGVDPTAVSWGPDGLAPAIVQDRADGRVLMLAWVNAEALEATMRTGEVHFHSRSRDRLWRKGETSGNVLRLVGLAADCDSDALLVTVDPVGPTCHRGTRSCFDLDGDVVTAADRDFRSEPHTDPDAQGFTWLEDLWATIAERARTRPAGSYTTSLLEGGVDVAGRKVTEEATEVLIAAKDASSPGADPAITRPRLAEETADLLYHALVLLAERGLEPREVVEVLQGRHGPAAA